jgi:hypothetical protein
VSTLTPDIPATYFGEKCLILKSKLLFHLFFQAAFYQLVLKLEKPVEQLVTLLGMLRQLLVMGLVTQPKLLVRSKKGSQISS